MILKQELITKIEEYTIYMVITQIEDYVTGKIHSSPIVYYDVCVDDFILESYKTLESAIRACKLKKL